jgi:hypothetical protein
MNYINPPVLGDAIVALRPGSEFALKFGGDYNLEWLDSNTTPPTKEEAEEKLQELLQEYEIKKYQRQRAPEYPSIGDQLDALFHAGVFPSEMAEQIQAVKDKYPKTP